MMTSKNRFSMHRRGFLKGVTGLGLAAAGELALPSHLVGAPTAVGAASEWPFFAFDNGVGRGEWSPEKQAATLKALGYDGISYNYTNNEDLDAKIRAHGAAGLKIFGLYIQTWPEKTDEPWDPAIREAIEMLKGSETVLWITVRASRGDHDESCVRMARELGDLAQAAELRVSIYPHVGFYVETARDAMRIAAKAEHPAVSPSYNLCHEFLAGRGDEAIEALREVGPHATLVSINGVDPSDRERFILPLGEGEFDMAAFLAELKRTGYQGPVGHQFYSIPGEPEEKLEQAIDAWRRLQPE